MKIIDKNILIDLFIKNGLNKSEICKQLGISLEVLNKNLELYNITRDLDTMRSHAAMQSREANFQKVFSSLDVERFKSRYNTSGVYYEDLMSEFSLTSRHLDRILKELGLEKRKRSDAEKLNALKSQVSSEELLTYYVTENHSCDETLLHFNITYTQLNKLLHEYNIVKDRKLIVQTSAKTKEKVYGSANYNNRDKAKETCLEKYGVDNLFRDTERMKKAYQEKLGVDHPMHLQRVRDKMVSNTDYDALISKTHATNLAKYGVENAATLPEVRARIRESVKDTFMNKYGATCYWTTSECKSAYNSVHSVPNDTFASLLVNSNIPYKREHKLLNRSYDFIVGKNLIEINPSATHNSTWSVFGDVGIDKYYHRDKSQLAEDNGYRCIHVWDWDDKAKIVKLLLPRKRVFARKCEIKEVDLNTTREYLNEHHLQGYAKDEIRIGLYYNDGLVSIMTFGKPRYNKKCDYELIRYCSSYDVVGGAEKLFSHFIKNYNPNQVVSYCDKSKFTGKTYTKLGFKFISNTVSKHWYNPKTDVHVTDNLLRQRGFDQLFGTSYGKGTSNEVLMLEAGFVEIFDAGQTTYIWTRGD